MSKDEMEEAMANLSREEVMSALFANLIVQHTNMALMFLGRVPHPDTGELMRDLQNAKFFIDQIEMLEVKTKGNLDKGEESLLKQSLSTLRMAFVEAVEHPEQTTAPAPKTVEPKKTPAPEKHVEGGSDIHANEDDRKKFSKTY